MKRIKAISLAIFIILGEMILYTFTSSEVLSGKIPLNECFTKGIFIKNIKFILIYNPLCLLYFYIRRNSSDRHRENYNTMKQLFKDIFI